MVYNCSSFGSVSCETHAFIRSALEYVKFNPLDSAISENIGFTKCVQDIDSWRKLRYRKFDLPAKALMLASKVPLIGSKRSK